MLILIILQETIMLLIIHKKVVKFGFVANDLSTGPY